MSALPAGFTLVRGWTVATMFGTVESAIAWQQRSVRLYGREVLQPRLTAWMGEAAYTYSGARHEPAPLPLALQEMRERLAWHTGKRFNSVLANLYRDGSDSVAWHADDEPELGVQPLIASVSLGAERTFQIRHNTTRERWDVQLAHGDLLLMSGNSQRDYQHAIPKRKLAGKRLNLTFRIVN